MGQSSFWKAWNRERCLKLNPEKARKPEIRKVVQWNKETRRQEEGKKGRREGWKEGIFQFSILPVLPSFLFFLRIAHYIFVYTVFCFLLLVATGCYRDDMRDQPRYEPLEASSFFEDGRSARPLVSGTVARGHLQTDAHLYTGKVGGTLVDTFPFPITRRVLEEGREQYNIFCSPCHDRLGTGQGMVVQRGFRLPPSFHIDRLREAPVGHFFDVVTNGFGAMYDYASRIPPQKRWAIVAYIRALQLSQHATLADVPADEQRRLELWLEQ